MSTPLGPADGVPRYNPTPRPGRVPLTTCLSEMSLARGALREEERMKLY